MGSIFDKAKSVGSKAMETAGETVVNKAKTFGAMAVDSAEEAVEIGKIRIHIAQIEDQIEKLQITIGRKYYEKYKGTDQIDPELEEECGRLDQLKSDIAQQELLIEEVKNQD